MEHPSGSAWERGFWEGYRLGVMVGEKDDAALATSLRRAITEADIVDEVVAALDGPRRYGYCVACLQVASLGDPCPVCGEPADHVVDFACDPDEAA